MKLDLKPTAMTLALLALAAHSVGCGALRNSGANQGSDSTAEKKHDADSASPTPDASAVGPASADAEDARAFEKLLALGPDGLALKIRSAFGPGLTNYIVGGRDVDYIQVNGTLFTGAVSPDPNIKIPKQLASVSYFMALNGLADVVSKNYSIRMATGTAGKKCTVLADATIMVQTVYPPVNETDRTQLAEDIVKACGEGIPETIRAIITSYAFALDTVM